MKHASLNALRALGVLAALFLAADQAAAQACDRVCTPSANCDTRCVIDPQEYHPQWTTCGFWGTCCPWVEGSRDVIGQHANWVEPLPVCEIYWDTRITEYKQCNPGQTRVRCVKDVQYTDFGTPPCCSWVHINCWGQQC
jgi:hypothetical protein